MFWRVPRTECHDFKCLIIWVVCCNSLERGGSENQFRAPYLIHNLKAQILGVLAKITIESVSAWPEAFENHFKFNFPFHSSAVDFSLTHSLNSWNRAPSSSVSPSIFHQISLADFTSVIRHPRVRDSDKNNYNKFNYYSDSDLNRFAYDNKWWYLYHENYTYTSVTWYSHFLLGNCTLARPTHPTYCLALVSFFSANAR